MLLPAAREHMRDCSSECFAEFEAAREARAENRDLANVPAADRPTAAQLEGYQEAHVPSGNRLEKIITDVRRNASRLDALAERFRLKSTEENYNGLQAAIAAIAADHAVGYGLIRRLHEQRGDRRPVDPFRTRTLQPRRLRSVDLAELPTPAANGNGNGLVDDVDIVTSEAA